MFAHGLVLAAAGPYLLTAPGESHSPRNATFVWEVALVSPSSNMVATDVSSRLSPAPLEDVSASVAFADSPPEAASGDLSASMYAHEPPTLSGPAGGSKSMSGTTPFAESGTAVMAQLDADIHVARSQVQAYMEVPTVLQRPQAIERPIITRRTMPDYGWLARALRERLEQVTSYPPAAKMNRWEGQVIVQVSVQADGHLVNPSIEQSSGYAMLDEAAIEALRQASPLALRHRLDRPQVDVSVPLTYQLE